MSLAFATYAHPQSPALETLLLARSLRAFGGALADRPLWLMVQGRLPELLLPFQAELEQLGCRIVPFQLPAEAEGFPFAAKVWGSAAAEEQAAGQFDELIWLDGDTLILQEPAGLCLEKGKALACCPVHIANIGLGWGDTLNGFWGQVYRACGVTPERVFPVETAVEGRRIRAYFNAGLLGLRPELGLLCAWRDRFLSFFLQPEFTAYYERNPIYRIFIHQAFLAGAVLNLIAPGQIKLLPPVYNFPLHLADRLPSEKLPARLNDLVTCRYDEMTELVEGAWRKLVVVEEPLRTFLKPLSQGGLKI